MKIGIVGYPTLGGSGMVAFNLASELANAGHIVHYISYKPPFFYSEKLVSDNLKFHQVPIQTYPLFRDIGSNYGIQLSSYLISLQKREPMDLINVHYSIPHAVSAYLLNQATNIPVINTFHGSDVHLLGQMDNFNQTLKAVLPSLYNTAVSNFLAKLAQRTFDLKEIPSTIYNFVDNQKFYPIPSENRELTIVAAGNYRPIKRFPFLVKTFAKICRDYPDWKLRMIGDGPERSLCYKIAYDLKVTKHVEFVPPTKNIPLELQKASILAAPSQMESFGLTIAEGMSSGLPIWASRVGGIPEVCIHGENGLLFHPSDDQGAEMALRTLMDDRSLRERLGKKARERILNYFNPQKIVNEYLKFYRKIAN